MSSNQPSARARAMEYSMQIKERKVARKNTQPNVFGKPKSSGPPSYAFQDQQRTEIDNAADETSRLRKEIKEERDDKEEDIVDHKDFKPQSGKGKQRDTVATSHAPPAAGTSLRPAFAKCWTTVDTIYIPPKYFDSKSGFCPTFIKLFEVLHVIDEILNGNEELRWISPYYFSLPVRIYYAIICYVQTYRAKEQAGKLTPAEGSWLRAFFRRFKDTSLPVVGPLVPILSNVVSVLPSDDQYDFVFPAIPSSATYNIEFTRDPEIYAGSIHPTYYILPNVPALLQLLDTFTDTHTALFNRTDHVYDHFNDDEQLVPFRTDVAQRLGNFPFPARSLEANPTDATERFIANPALMHPFPESIDRMKEIHSFWRRSKARTAPTLAPQTGYTSSGPAALTLIDKEHDLDWFQSCIDMATIQAKFFSDSTNLSAIPTVAGESALVQSKLISSKNEDLPTADHAVGYFYPDYWSSTTATFVSTAAELELDAQYAAAYALTNSTLSWQINNTEIGSDPAARHGPYWANQKYNFELDHPTYVTAGLATMVQTQFYDAHGKA